MKTGFLMFLLPPLALAGDHWNVMVAGGSLQFHGVIIAESCRVEVGDQQMTVNMGQVSSNRFHSTGRMPALCHSIYTFKIVVQRSASKSEYRFAA